VHIAKTEVLSPAAPRPHVLVAFNAPSLDKFARDVRPGGIVIYDSTAIAKPPTVADGVRVHAVPMTAIAQKLGTVVVKSVVALGALQAATELLDERTFLGELDRSLKHKKALIPVNQEAFRAGMSAVREQLTSRT
jgi:Pyruvate/2-oxoacid:ferredoxin oxidoreductase gamma subunit